MRKSVRGTLRESGEHLGIEVPVLRLILRSEHAALGGAVESFRQIRRVHATEELLEGSTGGGDRGGVLSLELTEVLTNWLHRPRAGRRGGQQPHQGLVDSPGKIQRRFRALRGGPRNAEAIAELVAALVQVHQTQDRLAQQLAGKLQRRTACLGGDAARIDSRAAAERG